MCWRRQPPQRPKYGQGASTRSGEGSSIGVDDPAPEARPHLHEPDPETIARQAARDEDHVAIGPPDALAAEGQVVDRQGQNLPAFGSGHGSDTINVGTIWSQFGPAFKVASTYPVKYHGSTMALGALLLSGPRRHDATAAVPALEERLLAERIRQGWRGPSAPSWPIAPGPASCGPARSR